MYHKINSQDSLSFVTLAEAKAQCNLLTSRTIDDDYITSLISGCCGLAQSYCNRILMTANVSVSLENYVAQVQLWGGEISAITSVTATGVNGDEVTITDHTFNAISQKLKLPIENAYYFDFVITYDAGYTAIPPQVKQAALIMISTMYNNRDDYVTGLTVEKFPLSSIALLNTVKHYVV